VDASSADRKRWAQPLDLAMLGELTAQWLEGSRWSPWNGDEPPDPETVQLVPYLAAMNRLGFATDLSQPGELDGEWGQRAAVTGYCEHAQAECLASLSLRSDLVVITHYPGAEADYELAITRDREHCHTRLAGHNRYCLQEPWPGIHPRTVALLSECYYVAVCDPQWGRDGLLWPSVVAALERDPQNSSGSLLPSFDVAG
jgi:hypothetical protein